MTIVARDAGAMPAVAHVPDIETVRAAARVLRQRGFWLVRLHGRTKFPVVDGWPERSAEPDEFLPGEQIGIQTGKPLDGRPDLLVAGIDLDAMTVVGRADEFLPETGMIDGRAGKPRSHRIFLIRADTIPADQTGTATANSASNAAADRAGMHRGPRTRHFDGPDGRLADFKGSGGQIAVPPSVHDSGELRVWEGGSPGEPAVIDYPTLMGRVERLAEACGWVRPAVKPKSARPATANTSPAMVDGIDPTTTAADTTQSEGELCKGWEPWLDKCRGYVAKMELPRTGQGGNAQTYRMVAVMLIDFALPRAVAWELFQELVNFPLTSVNDAWDDGELSRIFDRCESERATSPRRGCKRKRDTPHKWDDPAALADKFLSEHHYHFLRDTPFEYVRGVYRPASDGRLRSQVGNLFEREAAADYERRLKKWNDDGHGRALGEKRVERDDLEALPDSAGEDDDGTAGGGTKTAKRAKPQTKAEKLARLDAQIDKLEKQKPKAAKEYSRHLIADVISAVAVRCQLPDDTDFNTWLDGRNAPQVLSARNGLLNVETGDLLPHDPAWFSASQLPVAYSPDAPAPAKWLTFLAEVQEGDGERVAVMQEIFGSCLLPHVYGKWFALFVGEGNNGKSVAANVLSYMLGEDNTSAVTLDDLSASQFMSAAIAGKLANIVGDQGAVDLKDVGWLKTLTGGDKVKVERKGKDPIFLRNTAKLVAACNEPPKFGDRSAATWNRFLPVPFRYVIPAGRKNPAMLRADFWRDELPAILLWAVEGARRWLTNKTQFTRSAVCDGASAEHRKNSNPARAFLLTHLEPGEGFVPTAKLYADYRDWLVRSGYLHPLAVNSFSAEVPRAFPTAVKKRRRAEGGKHPADGYEGVRLAEAG